LPSLVKETGRDAGIFLIEAGSCLQEPRPARTMVQAKEPHQNE